MKEREPSHRRFVRRINDDQAEQIVAVESAEERRAASDQGLTEGDLCCDTVRAGPDRVPRRDVRHRNRPLDELTVPDHVLDVDVLGSIDLPDEVNVVNAQATHNW